MYTSLRQWPVCNIDQHDNNHCDLNDDNVYTTMHQYIFERNFLPTCRCLYPLY